MREGVIALPRAMTMTPTTAVTPEVSVMGELSVIGSKCDSVVEGSGMEGEWGPIDARPTL